MLDKKRKNDQGYFFSKTFFILQIGEFSNALFIHVAKSDFLEKKIRKN